jgi:hypothetical protein
MRFRIVGIALIFILSVGTTVWGQEVKNTIDPDVMKLQSQIVKKKAEIAAAGSSGVAAQGRAEYLQKELLDLQNRLRTLQTKKIVEGRKTGSKAPPAYKAPDYSEYQWPSEQQGSGLGQGLPDFGSGTGGFGSKR